MRFACCKYAWRPRFLWWPPRLTITVDHCNTEEDAIAITLYALNRLTEDMDIKPITVHTERIFRREQ